MDDFDFTPEEVLKLAKHRRGTAHPENIDNPLWKWMICNNSEDYYLTSQLYQHLGIENYYDCDESTGWRPDWHYYRFGRTRTRLPDGRLVCIGGQHEDWTDPDFCVYNDVIVFAASAQAPPLEDERTIIALPDDITIYGYTRETFTPTDHHAAVLVGDYIYIVGRWGYREDRHEGVTPIYRLNTATFEIEPVESTGDNPGYIQGHHASYDPERDAIIVRGGNLMKSPNKGWLPVSAVHRLSLREMKWELLREREPYRNFVIEPVMNRRPDFTTAACRPVEFADNFLEDHYEFADGFERYALDVDHVLVALDDIFDVAKCTRVTVKGEIPEQRLRQLLDALVESHRLNSDHDKWRWRER